MTCSSSEAVFGFDWCYQGYTSYVGILKPLVKLVYDSCTFFSDVITYVMYMNFTLYVLYMKISLPQNHNLCEN